jgi:hypothetical protein
LDDTWWANFFAVASAIKATIPLPLHLPKPPKKAVRPRDGHNAAGVEGAES